MASPDTQEQYPWLQSMPDKPEDYLAPTYYDHLLKEYSFGGREDIDILDDYLAGCTRVHVYLS